VDLGEDRADLFASQHDGEVVRALGVDQVVEPADFLLKNLAVEKEKRAECLVLHRRRDPSLDGQRREEGVIAAAPMSAGWRLPWKKM
jgi:hypothetical protein